MKHAIRWLLKRNAAWNQEFNFRSRRGAAEDLNPGSDAIGALPHSRDAPVPILACP
jgi:hypothetical protein